MKGFFKKLTSVDTYDHPVLFIAFTVLATVGTIYFLNKAARKANVPTPADLILGQ